jgi:transcription termination/antitermination protein NusA
MTTTPEALFDVLSLSDAPIQARAATATIVSVGRDVATVALPDGAQMILPVTEWWPERAWAVGERALGVVLGDSLRQSFSVVRPELVTALIDGVVPEVREGTVRVMGVARAPGLRSKIAVAATVEGVDAVAVMVGRGANRVKALAALLDGERIDVVAWSADPLTYARNALAPAQVVSVEVHGEELRATAPRHQMAAAVGESGLNSSLAGQLCGSPITIVPA